MSPQMSRSTSCPYCGYPLTTAEPTRRAVDGDTIETLSQEIRQLRETVARLRSAGDGRTTSARSAEPRTAEDA
jgi:transcription initiation factor IIE alpha subunit